jgi:hypothetical protein
MLTVSLWPAIRSRGCIRGSMRSSKSFAQCRNLPRRSRHRQSSMPTSRPRARLICRQAKPWRWWPGSSGRRVNSPAKDLTTDHVRNSWSPVGDWFHGVYNQSDRRRRAASFFAGRQVDRIISRMSPFGPTRHLVRCKNMSGVEVKADSTPTYHRLQKSPPSI